jgi:hypothetical protein
MRRFMLWCACALWVVATVQAQDALQVQTSGLLDVYAGYNFNNPPATVPGANQNTVRAFDQRSGALALSLLEVNLSRKPEPVGFTVTLTAGKTADLVHYATGEDRFKLFQQAYVTTQVGNWTIDVGKFVTALGAEVIESSANDNYSRSLPFVYAIPFYHAGIRASTSLGAGWGCRQWWSMDGTSRRRTTVRRASMRRSATPATRLPLCRTSSLATKRFHPQAGARTVLDTVLFYKLGADKVGFNVDFGEDKSASAKWVGYALYYRRALPKDRAVALRYSFFDDKDGFRTGVVQKLSEFTLTYEYPIGASLSRFEVRLDRSNQPFFLDSGGNATKKEQITVVYSQVFRF